MFVVIDIAFKRPALANSLRGRQQELQTIYNPHCEHLYPVSLQVFIILSDCSSFWIIFREPATFHWGIPLSVSCEDLGYRWQWQHFSSPGILIVSVHCSIKLEENLFKAIFHHLLVFILGIMTKKKCVSAQLTFMTHNSFHFTSLEPYLTTHDLNKWLLKSVFWFWMKHLNFNS